MKVVDFTFLLPGSKLLFFLMTKWCEVRLEVAKYSEGDDDPETIVIPMSRRVGSVWRTPAGLLWSRDHVLKLKAAILMRRRHPSFK